MNKKYIINIKELAGILPKGVKSLVGEDLNKIHSMKNAWLKIEGERIHSFGEMSEIDTDDLNSCRICDASGKFVIPTFIDSHTHLVFAGTREDEFEMRLNGASYEDIAARGGGILNSAAKLQKASEDELFYSAYERLAELIKMGTGAIEIKSGYGLTVEAELKMLRVIKRLKEQSSAYIKATFLGAHAIPVGYKNNVDAYLDEMIEKALPAIAEEGLAEYVDIFCEKGYFNINHTKKWLQAAQRFGLKPKIHVNQFNAIGGVQTGTDYQAVSVDHLEVMMEEDYIALKEGNTIATVLPLCSLFINIPYAPARELNNQGIPIAIATDYNPGSSPSGNMQLAQSLACVKMGLTPAQAFNASTINGAAAIEASHELGSVTQGKLANLIVTNQMPTLGYLAYNFGHNHVEKVFLAGEEQ